MNFALRESMDVIALLSLYVSLHEICRMILDDSYVHTQLIFMTHIYD